MARKAKQWLGLFLLASWRESLLTLIMKGMSRKVAKSAKEKSGNGRVDSLSAFASWREPILTLVLKGMSRKDRKGKTKKW